MHKNNFRRRQRGAESRLDETVRLASIVQKGLATGRSSYVEMRAIERIVNHNIRMSVKSVKASGHSKSADVADLLSRVMSARGGYAETLTPNGVLRASDLDRLLSIDSEISVCLGMLETPVSPRSKARDLENTLKELIEERKKLVGSLRA